jgi:hypothetical protein
MSCSSGTKNTDESIENLHEGDPEINYFKRVG